MRCEDGVERARGGGGIVDEKGPIWVLHEGNTRATRVGQSGDPLVQNLRGEINRIQLELVLQWTGEDVGEDVDYSPSMHRCKGEVPLDRKQSEPL